MELPSMVERSGDKLIIRSVVSGSALYMDQGGDGTHAPGSSSRSSNVAPTSALQKHFEYERYSLAAQQQRLEQHKKLQEQQQKQKQTFAQQATIELKDEELPQCKIKRNYSCNHCHHNTQNPRCHLTHMRDVHGEKIIINKCNLCLYASRHFQKVVRHMKMVHGCKEDIPLQQGSTRRRGVNREARKRKLEQSATNACGGGTFTGSAPGPLVKMGSMEQVKHDQQLRRDVLSVSKQQQYEKQRQQQQQVLQHSEVEAFFVAAYERQLQLQPMHVANKQRNAPITADSTNFQAGLNVHSHKVQEPLQKRLLKCSVCGFMTLYRSQLAEHRAKEHCQIKFFSCEKCAYVTHIKARFSKHVKYHTMPMTKCVTCDFRTPYRWNLERHMKNHGGAGPFKCTACDFTADIKQSLTVHEMNHHVPPVGRPALVSLVRRRNKVRGTDFPNDLSDSAYLLEGQFKNNSIDDDEDALTEIEAYGKRSKYDDEEPTDLPQKGGSTDTFSVHGQSPNAGSVTSKSTMPVQDPIPKTNSGLNLSKYLSESRSCLIDIGITFFNEEELTQILQDFDKSNTAQVLPTTAITPTVSRNSRSPLQKKLQSGGDAGCNFFDKLNQSPPGVVNESIICPRESIIHSKSSNLTATTTHDDIKEEKEQDNVDDSLEIGLDVDDKQSHSALIRHRCKSPADLLNHLKQCSKAGSCENDSFNSLPVENSNAGCLRTSEQQPMEIPVFVCNKMASGSGGAVEVKPENSHPSGSGAADNRPGGHNDKYSYGVETAPGYGTVTKKMTLEKEATNSSLKKVYKCPHCKFWATNASRFHVHIVGHLNKKPFECSFCHYRSNWRWDITKHIRLKAIRDSNHKTCARVLMNDESGQRNYSKYNKYMTLMKVSQKNGDPKLIKSGEMTPDQVTSSTLLNDYQKNTSPNGIKDIVTLGPIAATNTPPKPTNTAALESGGDAQIADTFMNLPSIATAMTNAATMAQQQEQEQQQVASITPSGTISAAKRSPPVSAGGAKPKRSCDLTTEVRQEGNERKMFYKCRKCNFRHENRDAVLAHINIHYQDGPVVTAMATSSSSRTTQHTNVSASLYPDGATQQQSSHSILPAGLLQEATRGTSGVTRGASATTASSTATISTLTSVNSTNTSVSCTSGSLDASSSLLASSSRSGGGVCIGGDTNSTPTTSSNLVLKSTTANAATASSTRLDCINLLAKKNQPYPSPYRCGHCHQLSNWKHVIQRHCRLKHANVIRVETLDRGNKATNERHVAPVYRLLDMDVCNESSNLVSTTKAHQQQIITLSDSLINPMSSKNNINKKKSHENSNNNNNLKYKRAVDQSLNSPLAENTINATKKYMHAATANASSVTRGQNAASSENLLVHQQPRPNEQVKNTRLPSSNTKAAQSDAAASVLAQLLPQPSAASAPSAQKQQLSDHMRSEHQQQATAASSNVSFSHEELSAASQFLAAAEVLQDPASIMQALLSFGVSGTKSLTAASCNSLFQKHQQYRQQQQQQQNKQQHQPQQEKQLQHQPQQEKQLQPQQQQQQQQKQQHPEQQQQKKQHQQQQQQKKKQHQQQEQKQQQHQQQQQKQQQQHQQQQQQKQQHQEQQQQEKQQQKQQKQQQQRQQQQEKQLQPQQQQQKQQHQEQQQQQEKQLQPQQQQQKQQHQQQKEKQLQPQQQQQKQQHQQQKEKQHQKQQQKQQQHQHQQQQEKQLQPQQQQQQKQQHQQQQQQEKQQQKQQQKQQHQLRSNELQPYKIVSYCSKCPARFPQKLHDTLNFKDFQNHLKAHRSAEQADYRCEFCDFMASNETKLQSHGIVHTSKYQEKCNDLIRNCKEDPEHPAPKLKQVAFNKLEDAQTQPAMIWVVDNELSEQLKQKQQQQNSSISSSSTSAPYDNTNSLLKKQLESAPAPISTLTRISSTTRGDDYPSAAPSTNASVAASDLAADVGRDCGSVAASPAPLKKCLHCPYVTTNAESYKAHLQHHTCISQVKEAYSCEHCDYTDAIEGHIVEHVRLHLKAMKKLKKVALLTSKDQLELSKDRADVNAANIKVRQPKNETSKGKKRNGVAKIKKEHRIKKAQNSSNKKVAANENTLQGTHSLAREKVRNDASTTVTKKGVPRKRKAVTAAIKATVSAPAPLPIGSATQCPPATKGCPKIAYKDDGCRGVKRDLGGRPVCSSSGERENIGARIRTNITRSSAIQPWSQQRNQNTILVNAKTGQVIRRN